MKIGIITFHRALNYGAVLQAYALHEYLKQCGYEVEIIEYIEDYSQTTKEENHQIVIRNLKGEEIGRVNSQEEKEAKEIAKSNVDKLTKKKLVLKLENETLQVERVYCY